MSLTDIIAGTYAGLSTLFGMPLQPEAIAPIIDDKITRRKAMSRMLLFLGATTVGLLGCDWPGYYDYDRYGYTPSPRIQSVSHFPSPAFINTGIRFNVSFYSSTYTVYSGALSYDTDGDGRYDDSNYVSYSTPGTKTVSIRATRDYSSTYRTYRFSVFGDNPYFWAVTLDGQYANGRFFAPLETTELSFETFDNEGIISLEYMVERWDGSSYVPHTPPTTTTENETLTMPAVEGQYKHSLIAEDTDSNTTTHEFITHIINPTVNPTGSFEHQNDGSVTYDITWGDLDTIIGPGDWDVRLSSEGNTIATYQTPNIGTTLPLDFVGELTVAIGKKQPDDTYRYTDEIATGLTGTNSPPYSINGPSPTFNDTVGASFNLMLETIEVSGKKDPNGDSITYHSDTLPSWVSLDQATGELQINSAPNGSHPFDFWTVDEYGADNYPSRYTITFNFF